MWKYAQPDEEKIQYEIEPGKGTQVSFGKDDLGSAADLIRGLVIDVPAEGNKIVANFPEGKLYRAVEILVPGAVTKRTPEGTAAGNYGVSPEDRITFRLHKTKGAPLELKLPYNSLDMQYLVDQIDARKPFKEWSAGRLFRVPSREGMTMEDETKALLKDVDPKTMTEAYNALVALRAKALDEQVDQLRSEGKNLQAFALKNKDTLLSSGMGTAAGALGYLGSYAGLGFIPYMKRNKALRVLASALIGAGAGTAVGFGTHKYLTRYTTPKDKATYSDVLGALSNSGSEIADIMGAAGK